MENFSFICPKCGFNNETEGRLVHGMKYHNSATHVKECLFVSCEQCGYRKEFKTLDAK